MAQALLKRDILRYADKAWELFNFMSRAHTRDHVTTMRFQGLPHSSTLKVSGGCNHSLNPLSKTPILQSGPKQVYGLPYGVIQPRQFEQYLSISSGPYAQVIRRMIH
jgi:hypothetical protein